MRKIMIAAAVAGVFALSACKGEEAAPAATEEAAPSEEAAPAADASAPAADESAPAADASEAPKM